MIKKLIDEGNILRAKRGIKQLFIIATPGCGFYHICIGDELVQSGNPALVDIHQRIKPKYDL